jgi:hypothetical protein
MLQKNRFILLLTIFLASCAGAPDHERSINFLVALQEPLHVSISAFNNYLMVMKEIMTEEQANGWSGADPALQDSLELYDRKLIANITQHMSKLQSLNEVDNDLKVKQETLDYLSLVTPVMKEATPFLKLLCKDGRKSLNQDTFQDINTKAQKLILMGDELVEHLTQFQKKYKITDEELHKHGLSYLPRKV